MLATALLYDPLLDNLISKKDGHACICQHGLIWALEEGM